MPGSPSLAAFLAAILAPLPAAPPPLVVVDRDNVEITADCRVRVTAPIIVDADGNGVIHVTGDDVTVAFEATPLRGAAPDLAPDRRRGTGIRVTGRGVTLRDPRVEGYRVGIRARGADGLRVRGARLADLFHPRLGSTPAGEDAADWLRPHDNDEGQWASRYGGAVVIEDAERVELRDVTVRRSQNGIILDRVRRSLVADCDCSFLSGWGLALWRTTDTLVSRNAFDFCVRGYEHGVYNRGQDSAGILLFEQCERNVFVENSATHGGDGFFAFAGAEALGERGPGRDDAWHRRRGCNDNLLVGNDFSYAAAHGVEITFSHGNRVHGNRIAGNAICGIWGGYSADLLVDGNTFLANGDAGYGSERGGVNIEHGRANRIVDNDFRANACGVFLWWDEDEHLRALPGVRANGSASADNLIAGNRFARDAVAVQLRRTTGTTLADNAFAEVGTRLDADDESRRTLQEDGAVPAPAPPAVAAVGATRPVGARDRLRGREHIVMGEWGPWDHERPLVRRLADPPDGGRHRYELRGTPAPAGIDAGDAGPTVVPGPAGPAGVPTLDVVAPAAAGVHPYRVVLRLDGRRRVLAGAIVVADWRVRLFAWTTDPRHDADAWRREAAGGVTSTRPALDLDFGGAGPDDVTGADAGLPADRFGTIATTSLPLPAGRWRLRTESDDGLRVWADGVLVIDDWTRHPPTRHEHVLEIAEPRVVDLRVEHFELDGHAVLRVRLEPADADGP
ncbi:MAG: right-handed parallel beta-helix repeat-containing protein [Planctomycetota bacterium]|jgi:parallel beta-helix repeat protein